MPQTYNFKLVLQGEAAVGKSSTVERFLKNDFYDFQQPTIGAAFLTQSIELSDCTIRFEIWDTAGQERYRGLAPMYYRGAAAALIMYDISDRQSYENAKTWIQELQQQGSSDAIVAFVGNKIDLEEQREVPTDEAQRYAEENNCLFFESSAKTGENVQEIFTIVAKTLAQNLNSNADANTDSNATISLTNSSIRGLRCCN